MNTLQKVAITLIVGSIIVLATVLFKEKIMFLGALIIPIGAIGGLLFLLSIAISTDWFNQPRHFNVFWWSLAVRYGLCAVAGLTATFLIWSIDILLESKFLDFWLFIGVASCLTIYFAQVEEVETIVPAGHVAMLTFWGRRFPIYLHEGKYPWIGNIFGIRRSKEVRTEGTTADGFINFETFPMKIRNRSEEEKNFKLECLAHDTSEVYTTLTLPVRIIDPMKWINSINPALDLADKAREALRSIIGFFTGIDNTLMKNIYWEMMRGNSIITVFLPKTINEYMKGSVIRSAGGTPMYKVVPMGDNIDNAKSAFEAEIRANANQEMMQICTVNGVLKIEERTIASVFADVVIRLGAEISSATVGNIDLSEIVTQKANAAASEPAQREAQIASAHTTKAATKIINEARNEGASEFELGLAAAADNENIKVVIVGGNNSDLTNAAATHGTLTGNNNGS